MLTFLHPSLSQSNEVCRPPPKAYLLYCIAGTKVAREKGVTQGTHQKHACSWEIWLGLLIKIEKYCGPYLEDLDEAGRLRICGAFMYAVRRGDFGRS